MNKLRSSVDATLLAFMTAIIACYCVALNEIFYSKFGPFYDSVAYTNGIARIMAIAREDGLLHAIRAASSASTVFLPFMEAAFLGRLTQPARWIGTVVQFPPLIAYVMAGYCYFRCLARQPRAVALCFAISLVSFHAVYYWNGGLSDFRMDLVQALAFGASIALYLTIRTRDSLLLWTLLGLVLGAACLYRATLPVYVVLVFVPFLIADFFESPRLALIRAAVCATVAAFVSGWFFVLNFDHLYYYYVIWNPDANARLPLRESAKHFTFLLQSIGHPLSIVLVLSVILNLVVHRSVKGLNWRALWAGLAPVAYLAVSGSGLNPFVCMVAIPGVMLFSLAPFVVPAGRDAAGPNLSNCLAVAALLASAYTISQGVWYHKKVDADWLPRMNALKDFSRVIIDDATKSGRDILTYTVGYSGGLNTDVIDNYFIFDGGFRFKGNTCLASDLLTLDRFKPDLSSQAAWSALSGTSDQEKLATLATRILASADIIILLDDSTPPIIHPYTPVNRYLKELAKLIRDQAEVRLLGGPYEISPMEKVNVYRNQSILLKKTGRCSVNRG